MNTRIYCPKPLYGLAACLLTVGCAQTPARQSEETTERSAIAAASLEDAVVVDCQLPGKLQKLGGMRTYLTPGVLSRLSAVDCRARGGEYTIADLSSGTLSLDRWKPLAEQGDPEAQYYVARIYANGMSGVNVDYALAAQWYRRAADQGYVSAQQELGYLYERGLGVPQDLKLALNLQRQASGLGEELDFASKIAAAREEAERQIAAMSAQLEGSNGELEALRAQLLDTTHSLAKSREELRTTENAVLDLRTQLTAARSAAGNAGDTAKVKELESLLAKYQAALGAAQTRMDALTAESGRQRTELSAKLGESQTSTAELNQLLAAAKEQNQALAARAAQAEQRLIQSRQELANLRAQYRDEVEQLGSEREALQRASATGENRAQALVAAKERELERQQLRVQALETELANAKKFQTAAAANTAVKEDSARQLAELQARHDAQQRQLTAARTELAALKAKSEQERTALAQQLAAQLDARGVELEAKQRRLASLEAETERLRSDLTRLETQRSGERLAADTRTAQTQQSLRELQRKLADQQERLDKLQTEKVAEVAAVATARDTLQKQLDTSKRASASEIALLKTELRTRETVLDAKQQQIAALEQQVAEQTKALSALYAAPAPRTDALLAANLTTAGTKLRSVNAGAKPAVTPPNYLQTLPGGAAVNYHALVIGNSNYRHPIGSLDTPRNDARDIAELLAERYGYKVTLLLDATAEDIMKALHEKTITLTESDNLLIYYAGHGDIDDPPERAYWLGVDADEDTRVGWLSAENIRAKIKQMKAKHVLLVADSCFSGAITHPTTTTIGRGLTETRLRVQWNRRARMVLTSGRVQPVVDRAGDPNHSFFAKYFIQILRQNEIVLSGEMLSYEINGRMQSEAAMLGSTDIKQAPTYSTLSDANHNFGDFFFVPNASAERVAAL